MTQSKRQTTGAGVTRRTILAGAGTLSAAGVISVTRPADASAKWERYISPLSGASISYPSSWALDAHVGTQPKLLYPHQSFAIRTASAPNSAVPAFPDLTSFPADALYMWLLHYDDISEGGDLPAFEPVVAYDQLQRSMSEFGNFTKYTKGFSGSQRSFLLRLWIGVAMPKEKMSLINQCISTLKLP
jgi:hypothetical protein